MKKWILLGLALIPLAGCASYPDDYYYGHRYYGYDDPYYHRDYYDSDRYGYRGYDRDDDRW